MAPTEEARLSSRGVLFPDRLPAGFRRWEVPPVAADLAAWWWVSLWDVPPGRTDRQHVLAHPAANLVVEPDAVTLWGPTTRASHRDLSGRGWAVAALLRPAGLAALDTDPRALRDGHRVLDAGPLLADVGNAVAAGDLDRATGALGAWLVERAGDPSPDALLANRLVATIATDESLDSVAAVAQALGVSERSVHRLAARFVGLTVHAMIRRRRLQAAAERVRTEPGTSLADVAAELGYSDQAHLARDFRATLGLAPRDYRAAADTTPDTMAGP